MSRVVLDVAVGDHFARGQRRLARALDAVGEGAARMFWQEWPGRPHREVPYGFKVDAFQAAVERGYEQLFWMDSSVIPARPIGEAWEWAALHGVFMPEDGWTCDQWTSDRALGYFGLDRDEVAQWRTGFATMLAVDLAVEAGREFLRRWTEARDAGAFLGRHRNRDQTESEDRRCLGHRHDQACACILVHQLGVPMAPRELVDCHGGDGALFKVDRPRPRG